MNELRKTEKPILLLDGLVIPSNKRIEFVPIAVTDEVKDREKNSHYFIYNDVKFYTCGEFFNNQNFFTEII